MIELTQHLGWIAQHTAAGLSQHAALVQAASGDSDSSVNNIAFLFLFAGFVFYGVVFFAYRNVNKRHHYESETKAEMGDVRAQDDFVQSLTGLTNSRMHGANNDSVRGSLNRFF